MVLSVPLDIGGGGKKGYEKAEEAASRDKFSN